VKVIEAQSTEATGPNLNTFYQLSPAPPFENKSREPLKYLPSQQKIYEIDFMTEKGRYYTIIPL
jgi:hypothetical protein